MDGFLGNLNKKLPVEEENRLKYVYSCGRGDQPCNDHPLSKVVVIVVLLILCGMLFRKFKNMAGRASASASASGSFGTAVSTGTGVGTGIGSFTGDFLKNQDVPKMIIGLLLLSNLRNLSNSFVNNILFPIIQPIIPIISTNMKIKIGNYSIDIGNFVSDIIVFAINLLAIYFVFFMLN